MEPKKSPKIVVIGSHNMDLVTETKTVPKLGETLLGERFSFFPGGKGANQAVACARLGAEVVMVGCVGDDPFGSELVQHLNQEGVSTEFVQVISQKSTGIASILVSNGENCIIVVPGANDDVTPEVVRNAESQIKQADIVLVQLEIPMKSVREAIKIANKHQIPVILNPAPAVPLEEEDIANVAYLTPNEHELEIILSNHKHEPSKKAQGFEQLLALYPGKILMTKGSEGAYFTDQDGKLHHQPSLKVDVVDTTGAGDTCNAALAVMLGRGEPIQEAVRFAVAAAALSVTKAGAQGGMPTEEEVRAALARQL